jgi:hypothetical protein
MGQSESGRRKHTQKAMRMVGSNAQNLEPALPIPAAAADTLTTAYYCRLLSCTASLPIPSNPPIQRIPQTKPAYYWSLSPAWPTSRR